MYYSLAIVAAVILLFQGGSILIQRDLARHARAFAVLTVLLAIFGFVAYQKFVFGPFVLSPEYGYLLTAGPEEQFWLKVLLVAFAAFAGLGWRVALMETNRGFRLPWLLALGIVIGLVSTRFIEQFDSEFSFELGVSSYDVWSPLLVVWVAACFVGSVMSAVRWRKDVVIRGLHIDVGQLGGISVAVSLLGFVAVNERVGVFDDSVSLWQVVLWIAAPLALIVTQAIVIRRLFRAPLQYWLYAIPVFSPVIFANMHGQGTGVSLKISFSVWVVLVLPGIIGLAISYMKTWHEEKKLFWQLDEDELREKRGRLFVIVPILLLALSLAGLFFNFGGVDSAVSLTIFFLSWTILSDALCQKGLVARARDAIGDRDRTVKRLKRIRERATAVANKLGAGIGALFGSKTWYGATVKVLVGVVLIIALNELPNAGRTIVMPFGESGKVTAGAGDEVADRVVHELNLLSKQIGQNVIQVSSSSGAANRLKPFVGTATANSEAFAKSGSIDIGGVKIPVQLLLTFIQRPTRSLFDVNQIDGTLAIDETKYTLMATSTKGEAWVLQPSGEWPEVVATENVDSCRVAFASGPLADLAKQLAYRILFESRGAELQGMSSNWQAFQAYLAGIELYNRYVMQNWRALKFEKLHTAIDCFQIATEIDANFAAAYYRLGLALQQDRQPIAAGSAFETSLSIEPQFIPAKLALAYQHANLDAFFPALPAGMSIDFNWREYGSVQAANLWVSVLADKNASWQDKAQSYSGLALTQLALLRNDYVKHDTYPRQHKFAALSAYYFNGRARRLYDNIRARAGPADGNAELRASTLNDAGVIVSAVSAGWKEEDRIGWRCSYGSSDTPVSVWMTGPYTVDALKYYDKAAITLQNDTTVQCNRASAALQLGDPVPMRKLENTNIYHMFAAVSIDGIGSIQDLERKLAEYDMAVWLDPTDKEAMNGYAYAFYSYRRQNPLAVDEAAKLLGIGLHAESMARNAVRIAEKNSDPSTVIYKSTLAEVLLALGRSKEALGVLEEVEKEIPDHPTTFEIRWDLAQAYSCIEEQDPSIDYQSKAQNILSGISEKDLNRDVPLFRYSNVQLDQIFLKQMCDSFNNKALYDDEGIDISYEVTQREQSQFEHCDRSVVRIWAPTAENFAVWVWGPDGVNVFQRVPDDTNTVYVVLYWQPLTSKAQYRVRLYEFKSEAGEYVPVSTIVLVDTFEDCNRNSSDIWFEKIIDFDSCPDEAVESDQTP